MASTRSIRNTFHPRSAVPVNASPQPGTPLTVLHVIDSLHTGGAENQLANHLEYADVKRFRHIVCSLTGTARLAELLRSSGIPVFSLDLGPRRDLLRGAWRLRRLVRQVRPDVLHATLFRAAVVSRAVGKLTHLPVITSLVSPTYEPEWLTDNPYLKASKVWTVYLIDRLTARAWGTWFVAISHAVKASAIRRLGVPPDRISVIPRGLLLDASSQSSPADVQVARTFLAGAADYPVILNVGRLVPQKGQRYAITAMRQVVAAYPRARLVIVGEGWLKRDLEALVKTLGLEEHVSLVGERRDVRVLMRAADLFVFSSLSEGFGVALLEALGSGRACVASRLPALSEVTDGGRVALLVDPRSPEALAEAIVRLAGDRTLGTQLGEAAAAWVREQYDITTSMRRLEELYGALTSSQRVRAGEVEVDVR